MVDLFEYFQKYKKAKHCALYTGIPMVELELFRKMMARAGRYYRVRYRGPRRGLDSRGYYTQQSTCLKRNATKFSVYMY
jgi:hypothetical protein